MTIKELIEALSIYDEDADTNIEDVRHFVCSCCGELEIDLLTRHDLEQMAQDYMEDHPEQFEND